MVYSIVFSVLVKQLLKQKRFGEIQIFYIEQNYHTQRVRRYKQTQHQFYLGHHASLSLDAPAKNNLLHSISASTEYLVKVVTPAKSVLTG